MNKPEFKEILRRVFKNTSGIRPSIASDYVEVSAVEQKPYEGIGIVEFGIRRDDDSRLRSPDWTDCPDSEKAEPPGRRRSAASDPTPQY
jgi:hypothetical protein